MSLKADSHISLIDLGAQLPFDIDIDLKKQLCFSETLVISCAHYEGVPAGDDDSESMDGGRASSSSDWPCSCTTSEDHVEQTPFEIKDFVPEPPAPEKESDDDEFHIYFFPDCKIPPAPQHSKQSIIIDENGMPMMNPALKNASYFVPCRKKSENVKICTCEGTEICACTCEDEEEIKSPDRMSKTSKKNEELDLCSCEGAKICTCTCEGMCICGQKKLGMSTYYVEQVCKPHRAEFETVCECPIPTECSCTCGAKGLECKCFDIKPFCVCGDPENCKCNQVHECIPPCICDILPEKSNECICSDKRKQILLDKLTCTCPCKDNKNKIHTEVETCTCPCKDKQKKEPTCTCPCKEKSMKIKKVRKGKDGWRWCNDVDPYHTFFDYGYDRHHLIDYKEPEKEVFKIFGLTDEKDEDICSCDVCGPSLPCFKKRVRKPSLDCCSSVGGISISVEPLGEDETKFLVNVVSHASKEGAKTASKLVSIVDLNLHTLEESRTESISKKDFTKERRNYMAICDVGYYNKVTRICGERNVVKRLYHKFENAKEFLLEGANVMLLRYIALRRYKGSAKTKTVLMDGTICESVYVSKGVSQAIVNGKQFFVVKVERHIIEVSGYSHLTLTVLSLKGYIISHEWKNKNYILHINPLLNVIPEKDEIERHSPVRERWREDLQLFSDFLDHKGQRTAEGARYISENGKLAATVRDYLQAILLLHPSEVMQFTRLYFKPTLSSIDLPRDEYFEPPTKHVRYFYIED